jgi:hypothetical protein
MAKSTDSLKVRNVACDALERFGIAYEYTPMLTFSDVP